MKSKKEQHIGENRTIESIAGGSSTKGTLTNPSKKKNYKEQRLGEIRTMNCGVEATITAWRNYNDIDIRFSDGTVKEHCFYENFKTGKYSNMSQKERMRNQRMNEVRTMNDGSVAEIIEYFSSRNMTIRYDDGTIRRKVAYTDFVKGQLLNRAGTAAKRLGMKRMMPCGMEAEIIEYAGATDITVRFSNGMIKQHQSFSNFDSGYISPYQDRSKNRIGQEFTLPSGEHVVVSDYIDSRHVEITFDNGEKCTTEYRRLIDGRWINLPSERKVSVRARIGETFHTNCGMDVTLKEIVNNDAQRKKCCLCKFADGTEIMTFYSTLKNGQIRHPAFKKLGTIPVGNYMPRKLAYKYEDDVYYICACTSCGKENILTPMQMLSEKCSCKTEKEN